MSLHWSYVFGPSTMGPAIWTDRRFLGRIDGAPWGRHGAFLSGSSSWRIYADGGWDNYRSHMFSDAYRARPRIYGWATLRFLCAIHGIDPPIRRLKGEPFRPDPKLVVEAVWEQLANRSRTLDAAQSPEGVPNHEGTGPIPIEELNPQAAAFWGRLRELHVERGLLMRGSAVGGDNGR